jgi:hypothetical protein
MLLAPDSWSPEKTRLKSKRFSPKMDWSGTFYGMHSGVERKCERTGKRTSE